MHLLENSASNAAPSASSVLDDFATNVAPRIKSFNVDLGSLIPDWDEVADSHDVMQRRIHKITTSDGQEFSLSKRFMESIHRRYRINKNVFTYWTPSEVFERIQEVHPRSRIRLTADGDQLLASSNPEKGVVDPKHLVAVLSDAEAGREPLSMSYKDGVVRTTHGLNTAGWDVGGDTFAEQFSFETPIDGYGRPNIYLNLLRTICANGMLVMSPMFRSEIQMGSESDAPWLPIARAIDSFNNEEGFMALRQRLEAAQNTRASLREVGDLRDALNCTIGDSTGTETDAYEAQDFFKKALDEMAGDVSQMFEVASAADISVKRRRLMPMHATVYDLINFTTEVGTHHRERLTDTGDLDRWIGKVISQEFDLEGMESKRLPDAKDFYLPKASRN